MGTHAADLGVLKFMHVESFINPYRGLDREATAEKMADNFAHAESSQAENESATAWPRIQTALRRGGLFVVESTTPEYTARLSFNPDAPDAGDYQIRHRLRGGTETGRTISVKAAAEDEDSQLAVLRTFATRYMVVTVGNTRPHSRIVWFVGLREFRIIDETDA